MTALTLFKICLSSGNCAMSTDRGVIRFFLFHDQSFPHFGLSAVLNYTVFR
jgi:hypothetical protein